MKIYELIKESFTSKVPYEVRHESSNLFSTRAEIAGRVIVFTAEAQQVGMESKPEIAWNVDFVERRDGGITFKKTGSGAELQVFSFVLDSIRELIARYSPDLIKFESYKEDGNRSDLYSRMIRRLSTGYGYKLDRIDDNEHNDVFVLRRTRHRY